MRLFVVWHLLRLVLLQVVILLSLLSLYSLFVFLCDV